MHRIIQATEVAAILSEALLEFCPAVEEHLNDWPHDPMLYPLVGALFQQILDTPDGPERRDLIRRAYAVTEAMLKAGSQYVRDCFAIQMIEPLSGDKNQQYYPGLEVALGPVGREELEFMREWGRRYKGMKAAIERANEQLGSAVFEAAGIGEGNASTRVIVNMARWDALTEAQRDESYRRLSSDWEGISGRLSGVTITGPRESNFRLLRG